MRKVKQVKMNGEIVDIPRAKVYGGEQIEISVEVEDENRFEPQNIPLNIVYEDDDIIVINKPKDLVVHPGAGNPDGTVLNALLYHYPPIAEVPRAGIVHRLDKDTTGLMVVAKTIPAQTKLVRDLQKRKKSAGNHRGVERLRRRPAGSVRNPYRPRPPRRIAEAVPRRRNHDLLIRRELLRAG